MSAAVAPVYGLILAGGASSRMQSDKAALAYQGRRQLDRGFDLAQRHVTKVFVSVRADQQSEPARAQKPLIIDRVPGAGPMIGIRSAFLEIPDVAWLVLACDLPFLSDEALEHLLRARDPSVYATAYRSAHDGLPEPLCAIWEPSAAAALAAAQAADRSCPRKFLINHRAKLIAPVDRRALDNVNTPEEYAQALRAMQAPFAPHTMQIKIHYYALLREQAGRSEEMLDTSAATPELLWAELNARYGFTLPREQLKVAVNSEFSDWTRTLKAGDAVVFIPPVAGG